MTPKRLTRNRYDSKVGGVCGGLARYLDVDATLIRVLAVVGVFVTFPVGLLAYVVMWAVMPEDAQYAQYAQYATASQQPPSQPTPPAGNEEPRQD